MTLFAQFNLALRAIMETGIIVAFTYWGHRTGENLGGKVLLGIVFPAVAFGIWGLVEPRTGDRIAGTWQG